MEKDALARAVEDFAARLWDTPDGDMKRPWAWREYDEGVRVAYLRTVEELRELAVRLAARIPRSEAQHILAQYHASYRDLQAVLLGVDDELAAAVPADGEWPLRRVLDHIIQADRNFFTIQVVTLQRFRSGEPPVKLNEEIWQAFWAGESQPREGPFSELMAYYKSLHRRILAELAGTAAGELEAASLYWESKPMPVRFRLHRFESHVRQHTVQAEKTLDLLGRRPNEARYLLRQIYAALAEVEGWRIGAPAAGAAEREALAAEIGKRIQEVVSVLDGP